MIIGCKCGNCKTKQQWDDDLQAYYCYFSCDNCGYYWETPIYDGIENPKTTKEGGY